VPSGPIDTIIQAVAHEFDLTKQELLSDSRVTQISHPRILAMSLARELTLASYPAIARIFARDQSTIQSAVKRAPVLLRQFPEYAIRREAVLRALHPEGRDPQ
jgi:chromosomal replication initiation ATPase DnaA